MTHAWGLTTALDAVLAVVLAPACAACCEPLERPLQGPVCARCWRAVLPLTPPVCDRCGDPIAAWRTTGMPSAVCPRCRRGGQSVDRGRAVGAYDGTLRAIIHAIKYDARRSLARPLGALMKERGAEILVHAAFLSRCTRRGGAPVDSTRQPTWPGSSGCRWWRACGASKPRARKQDCLPRNATATYAARSRSRARAAPSPAASWSSSTT